MASANVAATLAERTMAPATLMSESAVVPLPGANHVSTRLLYEWLAQRYRHLFGGDDELACLILEAIPRNLSARLLSRFTRHNAHQTPLKVAIDLIDEFLAAAESGSYDPAYMGPEFEEPFRHFLWDNGHLTANLERVPGPCYVMQHELVSQSTPSASTHLNAGASALMTLPAELRTTIYKLALVDPLRAYSVVVSPGQLANSAGNSYSAVQPPITRVSRQTRLETIPIFYAAATFAITLTDKKQSYNTAIDWLSTIGEANARLITRIVFIGWSDLPVSEYPLPKHQTKMLVDFTALKTASVPMERVYEILSPAPYCPFIIENMDLAIDSVRLRSDDAFDRTHIVKIVQGFGKEVVWGVPWATRWVCEAHVCECRQTNGGLCYACRAVEAMTCQLA